MERILKLECVCQRLCWIMLDMIFPKFVNSLFALSNTWVSESELSDHFFFWKTASIPEYPRKSSCSKALDVWWFSDVFQVTVTLTFDRSQVRCRHFTRRRSRSFWTSVFLGWDTTRWDLMAKPYFIQKYTISTPSYIGEVDSLSFRSISQKFGLITLKELVAFFSVNYPLEITLRWFELILRKISERSWVLYVDVWFTDHQFDSFDMVVYIPCRVIQEVSLWEA